MDELQKCLMGFGLFYAYDSFAFRETTRAPPPNKIPNLLEKNVGGERGM